MQTTTINGTVYGYMGWIHARIQSRVHLNEVSSDGVLDPGAPTLCGGRFTDDPDDELTDRGRPCGNCNRKAGTGKVRETGIDEIVRHVQAKETGATVIVQRVGPGSAYEQEPGWMTMCLNHGQLVFHQSRILAVRHSSYPSNWCSDCQDIAGGKSEKITGRKLT